VDKTHRASSQQRWAGVLAGLFALFTIGRLMVSAPECASAEGQQPIVRGADQPAGADSTMDATTPVARSIPEASLIYPKELAEALKGSLGRRPAVLHVGYHVLYRGGHIAGSRYVGPASKPEGLQALREAVRKLPRTKTVVLYCGCCPWTDCPNVRPAYAAVKSTSRVVKLLYLAKNLQKDWIDAGLPMESGEP
jgi:thiosulfate/3-mercaptopyruvate sulfurtransferase